MTEDALPGGADARFDRVVRAVTGIDGVTLAPPGRRFGSGALQIDGRIFAMLSHDRLLLKLPAHRVAALIASGDGLPFDAGKGRPMKEWVAVDGSDERWASLAVEALRFVGSRAER